MNTYDSAYTYSEVTADLKDSIKGEEKTKQAMIISTDEQLRQAVSSAGSSRGPALDRLADLQERILGAENRLRAIPDESEGMTRGILSEAEITRAMSAFDPVWDALTSREQVRVIELLVDTVDYHGGTGKVVVTFNPVGIKTLAAEQAEKQSEDAA